MMNEKLPALRFPEIRNKEGAIIREGFEDATLRDYLAGQALIGLLGPPNERRDWFNKNELGTTWAQEAVNAAYKFADAMLAERAKPTS
jgi:hypothetical protein